MSRNSCRLTREGERMSSKALEMVTRKEIEGLMETVRNLYLADDIPWVIGYSGGKDSTATLQLVWLSLKGLSVYRRQKVVHIIHTDTLVESPIVERWASQSLQKMQEAARTDNLPFIVHRLTPSPDQTFWVNLLGRGYPFPRRKYRWCTDRMKIKPVNDFIKSQISKYGEIILVLGTRKAESSRRARTMAHYESKRVRELLSPNPSLMNELVFSPISEWTNDDVWLFLMQYRNPWDYSNNELLSLYRGATTDNECPLMVSKDLPSCGKSRFGCWMCTIVSKDKSMQAMVNNDPGKQWLSPLLAFRNMIGDEKSDFSRRSFRKMNGSLQGDGEKLFHGPYKKEIRELWLKQLLELQQRIREIAPSEYRDIELISNPELREIRRIWVFDKHEFDDALPRIYAEVTGDTFVDESWISPSSLTSEEWAMLLETCQEVAPDKELAFELAYSLLDIEARSQGLNQRKDIFKNLEDAIRRNFYEGEEDATNFYLTRRRREVDADNQVAIRSLSECKDGND